MPLIDPDARPIVFNCDELRFTIPRDSGSVVVTIVRAHTSVEEEIATATVDAMVNGPKLIPVINAGAEWMAATVRLAWSEAKVANLEDQVDGARLMTTVEVAEALSVGEHTVYTWRAAGKGPKFIKLNKATNTLVRYRLSDLEAWLETCQREKTGEG